MNGDMQLSKCRSSGLINGHMETSQPLQNCTIDFAVRCQITVHEELPGGQASFGVDSPHSLVLQRIRKHRGETVTMCQTPLQKDKSCHIEFGAGRTQDLDHQHPKSSPGSYDDPFKANILRSLLPEVFWRLWQAM